MEKFNYIYENNVWGTDKIKNYKGSSGKGSEIRYNTKYIKLLKNFIINNNIKSVVDLGCGSFKCGKLIYNDLNIHYTGYDIYKKIINYHKKNKEYKSTKYNFITLDIFNKKENIISGDLCILKDVLQHWNIDSIYSFLDYLIDNKKFKYIIICNCCNQKKDNQECNIGDCRYLNCNNYPLKKYNPIELLRYNTKQVSVIKV